MRPAVDKEGSCLAIDIDTSLPLRRPLDLARLVDEVVKSGSANEASWLECKSDLDLSKHEGRYKVAQAVLSFVNRMSDAAEKTWGGLEPDSVLETQSLTRFPGHLDLDPVLRTRMSSE